MTRVAARRAAHNIDRLLMNVIAMHPSSEALS